MLNYIDPEERRAIIHILLNCDGKSCLSNCEYYKACKKIPFVKNIPQMKQFMIEYRKMNNEENR